MSKSGLKVDVHSFLMLCGATFNPLFDMKILTSEKNKQKPLCPEFNSEQLSF